MKQMFLIILLSTILFSSQYQIVLGSFSKNSNGVNATKKLNTYMNIDTELKENMRINSLKVELKRVGDYNVVALSPFDTKEQLLVTIKQLSKYYNDPYVLSYPLSSRTIKKEISEPKEVLVVEPIEEIVKEIKEEPLVEEIEVIQTEEVVEEVTDLVSEVTKKPIIKAEDDLVENIYTPAPKEEVKEGNYYLEYGLALLAVVVLLAISLFIYIRRRDKEETIEFDFTE